MLFHQLRDWCCRLYNYVFSQANTSTIWRKTDFLHIKKLSFKLTNIICVIQDTSKTGSKTIFLSPQTTVHTPSVLRSHGATRRAATLTPNSFMVPTERPSYYRVSKNVRYENLVLNNQRSRSHQHQWANMHAACLLCQDLIVLLICCTLVFCRKNTRLHPETGLIMSMSEIFC